MAVSRVPVPKNDRIAEEPNPAAFGTAWTGGHEDRLEVAKRRLEAQPRLGTRAQVQGGNCL